MKKKGKIKRIERLEIKILLDKGYSLRAISRSIDRAASSVTDEVNGNGGRDGYDPEKADGKSRLRRWRAKHNWKKIDKDKKLRNYITDRLRLHWNPDQISGRMKKDGEPFYASKSAIYEWLRSPRGQYWCQFLYTKRYRERKGVKKTERVMIPDRIALEQRPAGASNRTRYGHYESDSVVSGRQGSGGVSVLQERKSRYVDARLMKSMSSSNNSGLINEMIRDKRTLSITTDNGIEYKSHGDIKAPVYFCDPYSSWQKGSVENVNKMIRGYFPKGTDFSKVTGRELQRVIDLINKKPRKILGYATAEEVALKAGIIKSINRGCSD